ncbi:MAG TPA: hypothetical protein VNQ74_10455, partial [Burkholderiaceae bacterium]|nr:hypothetical protein [Burkholderiaceae bacterium]
WRHTRLIGALERGQPIRRMISCQGVFVAVRNYPRTHFDDNFTAYEFGSTNDRRQQGFDGAV